MKWSENSLHILGLGSAELAILEALPIAKSIQMIAQETKISRTGVLHNLKNLEKKSLVSHLKHGKRRLYIAISPNQLLNKMQLAIDDISLGANDKKGARIKTTKEDEFIIHVSGKEIIPAYERIASMNKDERIKAIQHHRSYNELTDKITPKLLIKFNQAIIQNNLIIDGILNRGAYWSYKEEILKDPKKYKATAASLEGRMADYSVFPDEFFNYNAEIWLFKSTSLIINWHEEVAIEITNANMTGFLRDMFEFVKNGSEKIDHNRKMREVLAQFTDNGKPIAQEMA
jgi:hypothetical protein